MGASRAAGATLMGVWRTLYVGATGPYASATCSDDAEID
ncbi:hypothetical protein ABIC73_004425 [Prescottella equi]